MRYLITISYDGRNYNGWQKQASGVTVQGELEKALKTVLRADISTTASGRTDAKVSAYAQVVHFDYDGEIDTRKFIHSMNGVLPRDIKLMGILKTDIHARFSAKRKTYMYRMYVSQVELPLYNDALQISPNLDFKAMKKFAKLLKGVHDFEGFKASGSEVVDNVRTIYDAKFVRNGMYLDFYITGNGFLYKMVRNIVGTMLKIGEGKLNLKELKHELFTTYKSKFTAKPDYLYLVNVEY